MRIRWTWRKALIAAVVAVAAVAFWWERSNTFAARVHKLRLGQTQAEVIAIMGQGPFLADPDVLAYWPEMSSAELFIRRVLPPQVIGDPRSVLIRVSLDDNKVRGVYCPSEGIDLGDYWGKHPGSF